MKPRRWTWPVLGICVATVLSAMAWSSRAVLELDRRQAREAAESEFENRVRLALWRIDTAAAALVAGEAARPYYEYHAFYPVEQAYTRLYAAIPTGGVMMPSPLLMELPPNIRLHFQMEPDGNLTSPQAPEGNMRDLAESRYAEHERILAAQAMLSRLSPLMRDWNSRRAITPEKVLAELQPSKRKETSLASNNLSVASSSSLIEGKTADSAAPKAAAETLAKKEQPDRFDKQDQDRFYNEQATAQKYAQSIEPGANSILSRQEAEKKVSQNVRSKASFTKDELKENDVALRAEAAARQLSSTGRGRGAPMGPGVSQGVFQPTWLGQELLLLRSVRTADRQVIQGAWIDWPTLSKSLLDDVADLLPAADLKPAIDKPDPGADWLRLTALPVELSPGPAPINGAQWLSPLKISLITAWVGVLTACAAAGVLLYGTLGLSERRAAFLSAVTHELRTPLTTVQMYTEMLAEGMVPDEVRRAEYLQTLRAEAGRLGHLIDNVLNYSRLESGDRPLRLAPIRITALVDHVSRRLVDHADHHGVKLDIRLAPASADQMVRVDSDAVERILFNLLDNAVKYARPLDPRVELHINSAGENLRMIVEDHGPGIGPAQRANLFKPFMKPASEAARSAPGVGLGLALCRSLAAANGARLDLDGSHKGGTRFILSIPLWRNGESH